MVSPFGMNNRRSYDVKKKTKIWVGIGAFVMVGSGGITLASVPGQAALLETSPPASASARHDLMASTANIIVAQSQGGEGEGGEGGEGGEAGINVETVDKDPVEYNVALQVIAAHYYAGFAAYEAKDMEAGAQMFAHGLSEVYLVMDDVFKRRGVTALGKELEAAVDAAAAKKPVKDVGKLVQAVLRELQVAQSKGPTSTMTPVAVRARVVANLLERAAAQYQASLNDKTLEPYLDGLGFSTAAKIESEKLLPALRKSDKKAAVAIESALKFAKAAYPGIERPKKKVEPGKFLAAASSAQLAVQ